MRQVNATYSTKGRNAKIRRNRRETFARVSKPNKDRKNLMPRWMPAAVSLTLVVMVVMTINFRAYMEFRKESSEFLDLNQKVQSMSSENLGLQEEIFYLKNDNATIEREAKKYGLVRPEAKNSRAGEMDTAEASINRQPPTRK